MTSSVFNHLRYPIHGHKVVLVVAGASLGATADTTELVRNLVSRIDLFGSVVVGSTISLRRTCRVSISFLVGSDSTGVTDD